MSAFRTDPERRGEVHPDDVSRIDRQMLLRGPITLYSTRERLRQHVDKLQSYGYVCSEFNCSSWTSISEMHDAFSSQLQFPDYYGRNLDALNDCLGDIDIPHNGGFGIILWNFDLFATRFAKVAWHVLDIIAHQSYLALIYGRLLLGLAHSNDRELGFERVGAKPVMWDMTENFERWISESQN